MILSLKSKGKENLLTCDFVMYTWMRLGLVKLLDVFNLIDDSKLYGGAFKLSQLLDIIGLDNTLDDKTMARLRGFTMTKEAAL